MSDKVFFQDHLFENLPVDKDESPAVNIMYLPAGFEDKCTKISLDKLLRLKTDKEWKRLYDLVSGKTVCIIDDVPIDNEELIPYKDFYVKVYLSNLSRYCQKCFFDNKRE